MENYSETYLATADSKGNVPFFTILFYLFIEYARPQIYLPFIRVLHPGWIANIILLFYLLKNFKYLDYKNIQTKLFISLLILMTINVPLARNNFHAYNIWRSLILYFIIYLSITYFVDSYGKISKYIDIWIFINLIGAIIGILNGGKIPGSGFMGDENDFALVMDMAIPFSFFMFLETKYKRKKIYYLLASGIFIIATVLSLSRGGFLGLVVVLFYCWIKTPRKLLSTSIIIVFVAVLIISAPPKFWSEVHSISQENVEHGTGAERYWSWKVAWKMFLDKPLIGVGQSNYPWNVGKYQPEGGYRGRSMAARAAHSVYFTLISELGIVGVIIFTGMLFFLIKRLWAISKIKDQSLREMAEATGNIEILTEIYKLRYISMGVLGALFGYLVCGIFLSVLYYPHFWILLAVAVALENVVKKLTFYSFFSEDEVISP